MFATYGLLSLLTISGRDRPLQPARSVDYRPRVEVWTSRGDDPYTSRQPVRVYFRAEQDAFVTIFRVDTDGRVQTLFPREPWEDNFARGDRDYEVRGADSREAFYVDDYPGVGYVFAVAAADPFAYDAIERGDHWDYRGIADGRIRGDPYVALTGLAERIVSEGYTEWDYDIVPYYVRQHYDYPRFLCYDCHTYVSYPYWSPYDYTCIRFRIVVFDDPYYYPYRYYGGTRVVFTRPLRPEPRFIFKDRQRSDVFVTRVRQRPVNDDRRREPGVRSQDLGGAGVVPPPIIRPRPRPENPQRPADADRGGRRRPDQTDQPDRRDQPVHPDHPEHPDRPDQPGARERLDPRDRPDRPDRPAQALPPDARPDHPRPAPPATVAPERPRAEPRREPEARPRGEPEAPPSPRVQPPAHAPSPPPRSEPRVEPKREPPREKPKSEPELKRRKP